MGTNFDLDYYLDKAEQDYLLLGKEKFSFKMRITSAIKAAPREFEREISKFTEIEISDFADRKIDGVKMGIPSEIKFDVSFLSRKRPHLAEAKAVITEARELAVQLDFDAFLRKNLSEVMKKVDSLVPAVKAAEYLLENSDSVQGLYPRQIPHGQSTKLLLEATLVRRLLAFYFGTPQISADQLCELFGLKQKPAYFHLYADKIVYDGHTLNNHHTIVTDSNVDRFALLPGQPVLIVENEETFHAIHGSVPGIIICGDGDKAASLGFLKGALNSRRIFYWGDIDKAGYEILGKVHRIFGDVIPIGMSADIIEKFGHLKQSVERGVPIKDVQILADEYKMVCSSGIQIEQEQLPIVEITESLRADSARVLP